MRSKFKLAIIVLVNRQTLNLLSVLPDTDFAVYCNLTILNVLELVKLIYSISLSSAVLASRSEGFQRCFIRS
jgi:hypothetical protein